MQYIYKFDTSDVLIFIRSKYFFSKSKNSQGNVTFLIEGYVFFSVLHCSHYVIIQKIFLDHLDFFFVPFSVKQLDSIYQLYPHYACVSVCPCVCVCVCAVLCACACVLSVRLLIISVHNATPADVDSLQSSAFTHTYVQQVVEHPRAQHKQT